MIAGNASPIISKDLGIKQIQDDLQYNIQELQIELVMKLNITHDMVGINEAYRKENFLQLKVSNHLLYYKRKKNNFNKYRVFTQ